MSTRSLIINALSKRKFKQTETLLRDTGLPADTLVAELTELARIGLIVEAPLGWKIAPTPEDRRAVVARVSKHRDGHYAAGRKERKFFLTDDEDAEVRGFIDEMRTPPPPRKPTFATAYAVDGTAYPLSALLAEYTPGVRGGLATMELGFFGDACPEHVGQIVRADCGDKTYLLGLLVSTEVRPLDVRATYEVKAVERVEVPV